MFYALLPIVFANHLNRREELEAAIVAEEAIILASQKTLKKHRSDLEALLECGAAAGVLAKKEGKI